MPILKNAKKALRVAKRKTTINARVKSMMKTMVDKVRKSPVAENLAEAYSAVDVAVKQNLVHKNKAARLKSQLSKTVKAGVAVVKSTAKAVKKTAVKTAKKTTKTAAAAVKTATKTASSAVKKAPKATAAKKTAKK